MTWIAELLKDFPDADVYLVGGALRDKMLKRPVKDLDYVVRGVPATTLKRFLAKRGKVNLVGKRFGVFKFRDGIDIALPRTERAGMTGGYRDFDVQSDARLPIEKDLARRDFTINAMAWDLRRRKLVDPFGGKADLKKKIIRAVGDPGRRFSEDHSRMLRALRFAATLRFDIERKTWAAIDRNIHHVNDMVDGERPASAGRGAHAPRTVPYEVAAREFLKAFAAAPIRTLDLWKKSGAMAELMPEIALTQAKPPLGKHPAVMLAVLLAPLGSKRAGKLVERLRFASVEGWRITPARIRRLVAGGPAAILKDEGVKPLLSAGEVIRLLGLKPGPEVGRTLDRLLEAQAKGSVRTKAQAIKSLRDVYHPLRRNRH